ncbi:MAG TPA: hypothetical protein ENK14_11600 [Caldithrix sp.]|nr:hypothetical protein [Caldithrix sp.]
MTFLPTSKVLRAEEQKIVPLFAYDAGTDSGADYTSPNKATSSPENNMRIEKPPFKVNETIQPVGTFTFNRTK